MNTPTTKQYENKKLHATMTVVPAEYARKLERALRTLLETLESHEVTSEHQYCDGEWDCDCLSKSIRSAEKLLATKNGTNV